MIISASRRTDIPAFQAEWFIDKLNKGSVSVKNPMNRNQVRVVDLSPENVDCFIFWTKNPEPLMQYINKLKDYKYYFQYTLNPYDCRIERKLPDLDKRIMTFKELSRRLDNNRAQVVWRYDPILMCDDLGIDVKYHIEMFHILLEQLCEVTDTCVVSFLDIYQKNKKRLLLQNIRPPETKEIEEIFSALSESIKKHNISIQSCCEALDLEKYGVKKGACIDKERVEKIVGYSMNLGKHKGQREQCGCIESVDIGRYDTCLHGCAYCYACR